MFIPCSFNESETANKPKTYEERYKEIKNNFNKNPEWLASIQQKERKISVDSMLLPDAGSLWLTRTRTQIVLLLIKKSLLK